MASILIWSVTTMLIVLLIVLLLLLLYRKSGPPQNRGAGTGQDLQPEETALVAREEHRSTRTDGQTELEKPVWTGMDECDLMDRDSPSDTDSPCRADPGSSLTKPQRPAAHRGVHNGPSHLPNSRFLRDIPFTVALPAGLSQISGCRGLFHLSLIYRRDAELRVHWKLTLQTNTNGHKMEPPACGIADSRDLHADSGLRSFREPRKRVRVGILQSSSDVLRSQNYFMRTSSCRFYLSLHRDYVTEPFCAPSARFMVTARRNFENAAPSAPVIPMRDLPDAARLAEFLLSLDAEYKSFMSFFKWKQFYNGRRRLTEVKEEFLCQS